MTNSHDSIRLDKLLWFLRLAPSRTLAQGWIEGGHFRVNGRRVERTSMGVRAGDTLTVPTRSGVRVITLLALPIRRGPAPEAQAHYRDHDQESAA